MLRGAVHGRHEFEASAGAEGEAAVRGHGLDGAGARHPAAGVRHQRAARRPAVAGPRASLGQAAAGLARRRTATPTSLAAWAERGRHAGRAGTAHASGSAAGWWPNGNRSPTPPLTVAAARRHSRAPTARWSTPSRRRPGCSRPMPAAAQRDLRLPRQDSPHRPAVGHRRGRGLAAALRGGPGARHAPVRRPVRMPTVTEPLHPTHRGPPVEGCGCPDYAGPPGRRAVACSPALRGRRLRSASSGGLARPRRRRAWPSPDAGVQR